MLILLFILMALAGIAFWIVAGVKFAKGKVSKTFLIQLVSCLLSFPLLWMIIVYPEYDCIAVLCILEPIGDFFLACNIVFFIWGLILFIFGLTRYNKSPIVITNTKSEDSIINSEEVF